MEADEQAADIAVHASEAVDGQERPETHNDEINVEQASSTSVSTTGATQATVNIGEEMNNASNGSFETPDTSMAAGPSNLAPPERVQAEVTDQMQHAIQMDNDINDNDDEDNDNDSEMDIENHYVSEESSNSNPSLLSVESSEFDEPEEMEEEDSFARRLQHDVIAHIRSQMEQAQDGAARHGLARLRRLAFRLNPSRHRHRLQEALRVTIEELGADSNSGANQESSQQPSNSANAPQEEAEEIDPENLISFDTNLPAEHSYLGSNMNRVCGVNYIEPGQEQTMLLFMHQHFLFPGEILPFMISDYVLSEDLDTDSANGLLFGVVFNFIDHEEFVFGVTCHIYEKGRDGTGNNVLVKSRALQRFKAKKSSITAPLQYIAAHPTTRYHGRVTILPEIFLRDPLKCIYMGSLYRFRDNPSMQGVYKRYQAASTPWPGYVYDDYSIQEIIEIARTKLAQHKIDAMPTDPMQLSFWLVRNMHFTETIMKHVFLTDCVNIRMKIMAGEFKDDAVFSCRYCGNTIADCKELFAMSKHGVQTQYCNSAGYIHETNTVYLLRPDAIIHSGSPSTEFSWFPGYQWHIINCSVCHRHMGWEFQAVEPNLIPKMFYGISGSSVRVSSRNETSEANRQAFIYRSLMRLARREPTE